MSNGIEENSQASADWKRTELIRQAVARTLTQMQGQSIRAVPRSIVELACGLGKVCGWFSWGHKVRGYEKAVDACMEAARCFPFLHVSQTDVSAVTPMPCDVLVLSDALDQTPKPLELLEAWLPCCQRCVIASTLAFVGGPKSEEFERAITAGGHVVKERIQVTVPGAEMWIVLTAKDEPLCSVES